MVTSKTPAANPSSGAAVRIITIAASDLDAAQDFYSRHLEFTVVRRGILGVGAPAGLESRPFTVLASADGCALRLIQAPKGAHANRPDDAQAGDAGLAGLSLATGDEGAAYMAFKNAGVATLSWPQYGQRPAGPGQTGAEFKMFTAIGPAGERLFIQRDLSLGDRPPVWGHDGRAFADTAAVLVTRDRWPMLAFYETLCGARIDDARHMQQDPVNVAIGAPLGSYHHYGTLAEGLQWREFRSEPPAPAPPWPSSLDRTGVAMIGLEVRDLAAARLGADVVAEGVLPDHGGRDRVVTLLRGPDGVLVEAQAEGGQ
jgi:catechol 2,3-dioxygenase-like lactoylglutathione lyase family enzyme